MDNQRTDREGGLIALDRDTRYILNLIDRHSGEWSWYQLANNDARIELAVTGGLMKSIRSLKASGFIGETKGPNPGQPNYVITEVGKRALADEEKINPTT